MLRFHTQLSGILKTVFGDTGYVFFGVAIQLRLFLLPFFQYRHFLRMQD